MDKRNGCCAGGDEIFLLCDKVQKGRVTFLVYLIQVTRHGLFENMNLLSSDAWNNEETFP